MAEIKKAKMAPFYRSVCKELKWKEDSKLWTEMTAENEVEIKALDEKIADAEAGSGPIPDCRYRWESRAVSRAEAGEIGPSLLPLPSRSSDRRQVGFARETARESKGAGRESADTAVPG